jgi:hypothetical protein
LQTTAALTVKSFVLIFLSSLPLCSFSCAYQSPGLFTLSPFTAPLDDSESSPRCKYPLPLDEPLLPPLPPSAFLGCWLACAVGGWSSKPGHATIHAVRIHLPARVVVLLILRKKTYPAQFTSLPMPLILVFFPLVQPFATPNVLPLRLSITRQPFVIIVSSPRPLFFLPLILRVLSLHLPAHNRSSEPSFSWPNHHAHPEQSYCSSIILLERLARS